MQFWGLIIFPLSHRPDVVGSAPHNPLGAQAMQRRRTLCFCHEQSYHLLIFSFGSHAQLWFERPWDLPVRPARNSSI